VVVLDHGPVDPGCLVAMPARQPLAARVWGSMYRTWFWHPDAPRQRKKGKRRSSKRERQKAKGEIRDNAGE